MAEKIVNLKKVFASETYKDIENYMENGLDGVAMMNYKLGKSFSAAQIANRFQTLADPMYQTHASLKTNWSVNLGTAHFQQAEGTNPYINNARNSFSLKDTSDNFDSVEFPLYGSMLTSNANYFNNGDVTNFSSIKSMFQHAFNVSIFDSCQSPSVIEFDLGSLGRLSKRIKEKIKAVGKFYKKLRRKSPPTSVNADIKLKSHKILREPAIYLSNGVDGAIKYCEADKIVSLVDFFVNRSIQRFEDEGAETLFETTPNPTKARVAAQLLANIFVCQALDMGGNGEANRKVDNALKLQFSNEIAGLSNFSKEDFDIIAVAARNATENVLRHLGVNFNQIVDNREKYLNQTYKDGVDLKDSNNILFGATVDKKFAKINETVISEENGENELNEFVHYVGESDFFDAYIKSGDKTEDVVYDAVPTLNSEPDFEPEATPIPRPYSVPDPAPEKMPKAEFEPEPETMPIPDIEPEPETMPIPPVEPDLETEPDLQADSEIVQSTTEPYTESEPLILKDIDDEITEDIESEQLNDVVIDVTEPDEYDDKNSIFSEERGVEDLNIEDENLKSPKEAEIILNQNGAKNYDENIYQPDLEDASFVGSSVQNGDNKNPITETLEPQIAPYPMPEPIEDNSNIIAKNVREKEGFEMQELINFMKEQSGNTDIYNATVIGFLNQILNNLEEMQQSNLPNVKQIANSKDVAEIFAFAYSKGVDAGKTIKNNDKQPLIPENENSLKTGFEKENFKPQAFKVENGKIFVASTQQAENFLPENYEELKQGAVYDAVLPVKNFELDAKKAEMRQKQRAASKNIKDFKANYKDYLNEKNKAQTSLSDFTFEKLSKQEQINIMKEMLKKFQQTQTVDKYQTRLNDFAKPTVEQKLVGDLGKEIDVGEIIKQANEKTAETLKNIEQNISKEIDVDAIIKNANEKTAESIKNFSSELNELKAKSGNVYKDLTTTPSFNAKQILNNIIEAKKAKQLELERVQKENLQKSKIENVSSSAKNKQGNAATARFRAQEVSQAFFAETGLRLEDVYDAENGEWIEEEPIAKQQKPLKEEPTQFKNVQIVGNEDVAINIENSDEIQKNILTAVNIAKSLKEKEELYKKFKKATLESKTLKSVLEAKSDAFSNLQANVNLATPSEELQGVGDVANSTSIDTKVSSEFETNEFANLANKEILKLKPAVLAAKALSEKLGENYIGGVTIIKTPLTAKVIAKNPYFLERTISKLLDEKIKNVVSEFKNFDLNNKRKQRAKQIEAAKRKGADAVAVAELENKPYSWDMPEWLGEMFFSSAFKVEDYIHKPEVACANEIAQRLVQVKNKIYEEVKDYYGGKFPKNGNGSAIGLINAAVAEIYGKHDNSAEKHTPKNNSLKAYLKAQLAEIVEEVLPNFATNGNDGDNAGGASKEQKVSHKKSLSIKFAKDIIVAGQAQNDDEKNETVEQNEGISVDANKINTAAVGAVSETVINKVPENFYKGSSLVVVENTDMDQNPTRKICHKKNLLAQKTSIPIDAQIANAVSIAKKVEDLLSANWEGRTKIGNLDEVVKDSFKSSTPITKPTANNSEKVTKKAYRKKTSKDTPVK